MKAKYTGLEVFYIVNVLNQANSKAGQGRQFIGINRKRFAPHYAECLSWLGDFDEEYPELEVTRGQGGEVAGFKFDLEQSVDGYNAFMKELGERSYEIEPYAMTDEVLYAIDGITMEQEDVLRHLTTERVEARIKAQREEARKDAEKEEEA